MRTTAPGTNSPPGARRTARPLAGLLIGALVACGGCAVDDDPAVDEGYGVFAFALGSKVPGASHMSVSVFQGPVTQPNQVPRYALGCVPYADADGSVKNPFTLDQLPVRNDYAVLVELFADSDCTDTVLRAYRGGIAVKAVTTAEAAEHPYYLQPAMLGAFTGMAQASAEAAAEVAKRSCTADAECQSAHPAAVCRNNKCELESLFPLNGGARRGLPTATTLEDGRVVVHGGVSVPGDGKSWTATSQRVEVFDPRLGRFESPAALIDAFEDVARTALGQTVAAGSSVLWTAAGSSRLVIAREGNKLRTGLDAASCTPGSTTCPVSDALARADLAGKVSVATTLPAPRGLPIVERMVTPAGQRLFVAGGAQLPLPKSGDSRLGDARLCQLEASTATCTDATGLMAAARANAATLCLDRTAQGCRRLLIFGGRASKAAPLAEIYDATNDVYEAVQFAGGNVPEQSHGGSLIALDGKTALLLGATSAALFLDPAGAVAPGGIAPLRVDIDESTSPTTLTLTPIALGAAAGSDGGKRALATAAAIPGGGALLVGGVDAAGAILGDALQFDAEGTIVGRVQLERARYGARLQPIGGAGPFGGCLMLVGGFSAASGGADEAISHIELFCPKAP